MNNEVADYIIAEEGYNIDVQSNRLIHTQDPKIELSIYDMLYTSEGYYFSFDTNEKRILMVNNKEDARLRMPHLCTMVPDKVAKYYNIDSHDLHTKTDYEVLIDKQAFFDRQLGKLPIVDISGNRYVVDYDSGSLKSESTENLSEIKFSDLIPYYDVQLKTAVFPYNIQKKMIQDFDISTLTAIPDDLVLVQLPHHFELDPIGAYRSSKESLKDLQNIMPNKSIITAKIIYWNDTTLPEIIKKNVGTISSETTLENKSGSKKIR